MSLFNLFKKKNDNSLALPVRFDYTYYAENIPPLVQTYKVFKDSFLARISESFLNDKTAPKVTTDDLLEGIDYNYAWWVFNHCQHIIAARYSLLCSLENAKKAEVSYIDFKVFRPCPTCDKIPKNQKFKMTDNIPLYPCLDCKEENICIFAYDYRWD